MKTIKVKGPTPNGLICYEYYKMRKNIKSNNLNDYMNIAAKPCLQSCFQQLKQVRQLILVPPISYQVSILLDRSKSRKKISTKPM